MVFVENRPSIIFPLPTGERMKSRSALHKSGNTAPLHSTEQAGGAPLGRMRGPASGRCRRAAVRGKHYIHWPKGHLRPHPCPLPPAGEGDILDFSRQWQDSLVAYQHKELYKVKLQCSVQSRSAPSPHPGCGALPSDTRKRGQSNIPRYPSKRDSAHSRSGTGDQKIVSLWDQRPLH